MIQVTERKTVPENCSTCLYGAPASRLGAGTGTGACANMDTSPHRVEHFLRLEKSLTGYSTAARRRERHERDVL